MEKGLSKTSKVNQTLTILLINPTPNPKKNENLCSHIIFYMKDYSSFIYNYLKLKITQIFIILCMVNNLWYTHTVEYHTILVLSNPMCIILSDKSQIQKVTYCMFLVILQSEKIKKDRKKDQ